MQSQTDYFITYLIVRVGRTVLPLQNTMQHPSPALDDQIQDLAGNPIECTPLRDRLTRPGTIMVWWSGHYLVVCNSMSALFQRAQEHRKVTGQRKWALT